MRFQLLHKNNTRIVRGIAVVIFSLFMSSVTGIAQSDVKILEQCVEFYNSLQDDVDRVIEHSNKTVFADSIYDAGQPTLERLKILMTSSDAEVAKCSRYFHMNLQYSFAFAYGAAGLNKKSMPIMDRIYDEMEWFTESKFPMKYLFFDKNYTINWENFSPTKCEFYVAYGELTYKNGNYNMSMSSLKNALPMLGDMVWLRYICYSFLLDNKTVLNQMDEEYVDLCAKQLSAFYNLSPESLKLVEENKYQNYKSVVKKLDDCLDVVVMNQGVYNNLIGAANVLKYYIDPYKESEESQRSKNKFTLMRWYDTAISSPYFSKDAVKTAYTFAHYNAPNEISAMTSWLKRYETLSLDCNDYLWLMDRYDELNDPASKASIKPRYDECQAKAVEQEKLAAEQRRKDEERAAKSYRKASRMPLFYVGFNLFPFFSKPRDYGLALNVGGSKMVFEVSYLKVNGKKENYFDLSLKEVNDVPEHRWDGYFAHVNFKFPMDPWDNGQARSYAGFVFAYNEREFEPFTSNVTDIANSTIALEKFSPTTKQYLGMVNMGFMGIAGFGIDSFFGIGAAYNQFDGGNPHYGDENFQIEDAMVANRTQSYWSFSMRMGISIGIGFARE
jgi:hypothetical protein